MDKIKNYMDKIENYCNFNIAGGSSKINNKVLNKMIEYNLGVNINGNSNITNIGQKLIAEFKSYLFKLLNTNEKHYTIILTSSASESNNLCLRGIADYYNCKNIIPNYLVNSIEHETTKSCINLLCNLNRIKLFTLPVKITGEVDFSKHSNNFKNIHFVSIMSVNNELGSINNINHIFTLFKNNNTIIHSDISQSFGKECFDLNKTPIHLLSICPHKILSAPTSIGLLIMRNDIKNKIICQISGNNIFNQGLRGATLNAMLIAGTYEAFKINFNNRINKNKYILQLKNYFIEELYNNFNTYYYQDIENNIEHYEKPFILILSPKNSFYHIVLLSIILDNNCNIKFKHFLEKNKILCSISSVCQTSSAKSSFVLDAINIYNKNIKRGVLRFSFSELNTTKEILYLIQTLKKLIKINFKNYHI
jgi:cysteine desulfurase